MVNGVEVSAEVEALTAVQEGALNQNGTLTAFCGLITQT